MTPNGFIKGLLFSNIFYGCCAVALSVETAFQQQIPLTHFSFYLVICSATTLYYTHAYIHHYHTINATANERTIWYFKHRGILPYTQLILLTITIATAIALFIENQPHFKNFSTQNRILLFLFPLLAAMYYGAFVPGKVFFSLRNYGLIKPFLIGLIWAGTVSLIPVIYHDLVNNTQYVFTTTTAFLVTKNWLFITILCILFDFKDYADDHNLRLKTFIVRLGLRTTLFQVILPMAIASWAFFVAIAFLEHFPFLRILINGIPFGLLIIVCYSMYQRKSILYYLAIIDGLMLVKAICGITGMIVVK